jgi:hypothetical protein
LLEASKRREISIHVNDTDATTYDKQQADEFIIPMPKFFQRRSLLEADIDPDTIRINVFADNKLHGSLSLSSEDLRMLVKSINRYYCHECFFYCFLICKDLPNLQTPAIAPVITIDDSATPNVLSPMKIEQHNFDQASAELYKAWLTRTPQSYGIYNEKHENIGKLPLHMFWYNQIEMTHATKCTSRA